MRVLVEGTGRGDVLVLDEPLSFWGGVDPETGEITDRRHPQRDLSVAGKVLVMPAGRGSSSSSNVLAEAVRLGTAPAAILLAREDPIIALGALVALELYGSAPPVVVLDASQYGTMPRARAAELVAKPDGGELRTWR